MSLESSQIKGLSGGLQDKDLDSVHIWRFGISFGILPVLSNRTAITKQMFGCHLFLMRCSFAEIVRQLWQTAPHGACRPKEAPAHFWATSFACYGLQ